MDGTRAARLDDLLELVTASLTPLPACPGPGAVGVESEHFLIHAGPDGRPEGRATLAELTGLLDDHPQLDPEPPDPGQVRGWRLADGSRFLPEPGAQLEYAGLPHDTAAGAIAALSAAMTDVASLVAPRGVAVASAGLDLWHHGAGVPQQLTATRYPAMHGYLSRRSPHGHTMMTNSASLQVNLDLGVGDQPRRRWSAAMLLSPLITASFAASPVPGAVNGRALVWAWLDPTRTEVPRGFVAGIDDPVGVLVDAALDADVLLWRTDHGAEPGEPGFSLRRWLADGHPRHGRPTVTDLGYHLTTLFPPARARGFLEVRGIDSLPARWRMVPIVLLAGLAYDDRALEEVLAVLLPHRGRLPELARRAIHLGVTDGELCAMSVEVWSAALEGARRLPAGWVDGASLQRTETYIDRFTMRGRTPADELRDLLGRDLGAALDWAREPIGSLHPC